MRISTTQYFNKNTSQMTDNQARLSKLQGQLATGNRIEKPSDDPLAMATSLGAKAGVKQLEAYQSNITYINNQMGQLDDALGAASEVMIGIKESMIQAGNSVLSPSDRAIIVQELRGRVEELRGIANRTGPNGDYLLSGTNSATEPFPAGGTEEFLSMPAAAGAAIKGRTIDVANGRQIDLNITGYQAFVNPNTSESAFKIMDDAINLLANPGYPGAVVTPPQTLAEQFQGKAAEMDDVFNQLQLSRTKVGVRLREAETISNINNSAITELQRVSGDAAGLDYAKAISELSQGQLQLQATQQSFASVSKLSLFNYLS
jgi:flagellar hook-associated protein 3 FlgL